MNHIYNTTNPGLNLEFLQFHFVVQAFVNSHMARAVPKEQQSPPAEWHTLQRTGFRAQSGKGVDLKTSQIQSDWIHKGLTSQPTGFAASVLCQMPQDSPIGTMSITKRSELSWWHQRDQQNSSDVSVWIVNVSIQIPSHVFVVCVCVNDKKPKPYM